MDKRLVEKEWRDADGHWSYELELAHRWKVCPQDERDRIIKYIKLLKWYNQDPTKISFANKKWITQNSDCDTEILPIEISNKYRIN